jgi:hypothetical protein
MPALESLAPLGTGTMPLRHKIGDVDSPRSKLCVPALPFMAAVWGGTAAEKSIR